MRFPALNKFIDLFAGIGGFRVALEQRGMKCVFTSEVDKHARIAYQQQFKEEGIFGDITKIKARDIPGHDVLCAGFPCQTFSISGKHAGLDDNRGRLFYEIIRIAKYHKPYVLLLENVKNILSVDGGNVFKVIEKKLDETGYLMRYCVLNASHFGIPQKRERVYFACLRKDRPELAFKPPKPSGNGIYLSDILERNDDVDGKLFVDRNDIEIERKDIPVPDRIPIRIGFLNKGGQGERIYHPNGHAITLSANGGGVGARTGLYYVDGKVRRLSINECKKLMGFSKGHKVSHGLQGYKQLGNAVIPAMVGMVFDNIEVS